MRIDVEWRWNIISRKEVLDIRYGNTLKRYNDQASSWNSNTVEIYLDVYMYGDC